MHIKVLYSIEKNKKNVGGGGGEVQYLNPKHSQFLKKKKKTTKVKEFFFLTEPGLEPTTSGLEKKALLSTRLNTIIAIIKYNVRKLRYSNSNY